MSTMTSQAGPSTAPLQAQPSTTGVATKLAKNKRLPATMINPSTGHVEASKKTGKKTQLSAAKRKRVERGKERALELSSKLETKVREREDKKAKRVRAKKAWE